jgi:ornithine cyclodeaminase/alanine dehydrogenase-like protein (mu-crystallin family)
MLVLGRDEVRELLDLDALIDGLAAAMADLSAGRASAPPSLMRSYASSRAPPSSRPTRPDVIEPVCAGVLAEDAIADVGELVLGTRPGRSSEDQITLYKSVGVAVQDAAAATLVLAAAREHGAGREIDLD